jgi:hypothetical protein
MSDIPIQLDVTRTERQRQAWDLLADPAIRRVLYGGAKGGGKSFFLCVWAFVQAYALISRFNLPETKNPLHVGWIGRKQATDFTATTLQTWRQTIPEQYYELKGGTEKDSKHILIMGRVAIDYGGLDRQENINKFNSAEYSFFAIDQAEETSRDDVSVLQGSLRLTIDGVGLDYKELYTASTDDAVVKAINVASLDSAARVMSVWVIGTNSQPILLGAVNIPANSGNNGTAATVDLLGGTLMPSLPYDNSGKRVLPLPAGYILKAGTTTTVTSAQSITVTAIAEDY